MSENVSQKLIGSHLVEGRMEAGQEIGLKVDQTLTQDATGTMVMLELEAMNLSRVKTELSAQYVDHNLLQTDFKNPDDHLFLQRLQKVWHLVQPCRERHEPSGAHGALRRTRQNVAGLG
jgi:aconitate hydratase